MFIYNIFWKHLKFYMWKKFKLEILFYKNNIKFSNIYNLLNNDVTLRVGECFNLYSLVNNTKKLKGCIAEVGVFKGGSAELIGLTEKKKRIYVFDTFKGIPNCIWSVEWKTTNYEDVKKRLKKYKNIKIYKGYFPYETSSVIRNINFSLVHLDIDIYQTTLDSLNFFYPQMVKGGIIILHDYKIKNNIKTEVYNAVNSFIFGTDIPLVLLSGSHVIIIKI